MARKRANGEGSLRKRKNGTWEGRVSLGVDPNTGKTITKSLYGRTEGGPREDGVTSLRWGTADGSSG